MGRELFRVVYEDDRLLVIDKPAGLVCHPTKGDAWSSLIGRVRLRLGAEATAHLVNRLDRETSGLIVVARDDGAAWALRRAWEARQVKKSYDAIVHGHVSVGSGTVEQPLGADDASPVAVKDRARADGARAATRFETVRRFERPEGPFSWLKARPITGRKHQIRIHLAHIGHPIVGDKIYGGDETAYLDFVESRLSEAKKRRLILANHALCATGLEFELDGETRSFRAGMPEPMRWFLDGERDLRVEWLDSPSEI